MGEWTGWDLAFGLEGNELVHVSKKWIGIGKVLLTSADNYILSVANDIEPDHPLRKLILAAVIGIDMVLKE